MYPASAFWDACTSPFISRTICEFMSFGSTSMAAAWSTGRAWMRRTLFAAFRSASRCCRRRHSSNVRPTSSAWACSAARALAFASRCCFCLAKSFSLRSRHSSRVSISEAGTAFHTCCCLPAEPRPWDLVASATLPEPRTDTAFSSIGKARSKCDLQMAMGIQKESLCFHTPCLTPRSWKATLDKGSKSHVKCRLPLPSSSTMATPSPSMVVPSSKAALVWKHRSPWRSQ
mmetsp:Transcript_74078/g.204424  ORF Transcript_74078/g.204424 Transcript_74078/m.204424 type:complete len:230 (-) Transcript_74078:1393-2082(-)